jgi:hypothetical protein
MGLLWRGEEGFSIPSPGFFQVFRSVQILVEIGVRPKALALDDLRLRCVP